LKKVAVNGGAPTVLCDIGTGISGASWEADDTIVYADAPSRSVMRISADGGTPKFLIKTDPAKARESGFPVSARMLPDGKNLLFSNILPNGSQLAVQSLKSCQRKVLLENAGAGAEEKLASEADEAFLMPRSWSKDGKMLVTYGRRPAKQDLDIVSLSMESGGKWSPLLQDKSRGTVPQISPDGRWMAYCSDESGRYEVYVSPFPEVNTTKWQVSVTGGEIPLWSPDGHRLFYRDDDAVIAVAVETEPTFQFGKPVTLFRGSYGIWIGGDGHPWAISPDGKRFLMLKPHVSEGAASTETVERPKINIVVNWTEELKQHFPAK
jgi:hypothetical protein